MRQITAIIQPHMLTKVEHALRELPHFPGLTTIRAKGHGRGRAAGHAHLSTEQDIDAYDKIALIIVCSDSLAPSIAETVRKYAHTGLPGDGIITVCEASEVIRIGDGSRGDDAT